MITLAFYVDLKRGNRFTLLVGPFRTEALARTYEEPAYRLATRDDPDNAFARFGVVSVNDHLEPGVYNDELGVSPGELLAA